GVGADVARVGGAEADKGPVRVERELGVGGEVAAVIVGQEGLAPLGGPLHRPPRPPRRPGDERELRIAAVARPEVATHVAPHHPPPPPPTPPPPPGPPRPPATPVRVRPRPPAPA